jgi:hypothetical protein
MDNDAQLRLRAYVRQAREYYRASRDADPSAKPLLAYYFALNLAKAYLTAHDADVTAGKMSHGASSPDPSFTGKYNFSDERVRPAPGGVLKELAVRTGRGFAWAASNGSKDLEVAKLLPYLVEAFDLYSASQVGKPKLLPISECMPRGRGARPRKETGLVVRIPRMTLDEAGLKARKVLTESATFGATFDLVDDGTKDYATYESRSKIGYAQMPAPLSDLRSQFEQTLLLRNRALPGGQDYIVLSPHVDLVSSEALTFALLLHLSNMVRYRPHHVDALAGGPYWWLFTSWVDRACENYLLALSTRVSLQEHVIS